jgi:predicted O-methyltransferase YrrM
MAPGHNYQERSVKAMVKMKKLANTIYESTLPRASPRLAGILDYLRPSLRASWGGPMNGQPHRQEIVRDLMRLLRFEQVVETGTFRGATTEFLWHVSGAPVLTVESEPRYYTYARTRLSANSGITTHLGDSRSFLSALAGEQAQPQKRVFFYLDAHWSQDLPLWDELSTIASAWEEAVVMVDDFQVPGDTGYGFDDYGPGKALTEINLPRGDVGSWARFYPARPSTDESGAKRGALVLSSPRLVDQVSQVRTLRSEDLSN